MLLSSSHYPNRLANALTIRKWQYCAISCGSLCAISLLITFAISGNIPPTAPWWDAERVHNHYWSHLKGTQASSIFFMASGAFYLVYSAAITQQMRLIPGIEPIIPDLQLAAAAASFCAYMMPAVFLALLTFRDYGPELTQLLHDIFWLSSFLPWPVFCVQWWTIAWAILGDTSTGCGAERVFPLSMGFVNLVAPFAFALGAGVHVHLTGAFAWNGACVFWMTLAFLGLQINLDCWCMFRNVSRKPVV